MSKQESLKQEKEYLENFEWTNLNVFTVLNFLDL